MTSLGMYPHSCIHAKFYGSEQVVKMSVPVGSLFIVWPRSGGDALTGSHNGYRSAHWVTRDEACLKNKSVASANVERMALRNKCGVMGKGSRCRSRNVVALDSRRPGSEKEDRDRNRKREESHEKRDLDRGLNRDWSRKKREIWRADTSRDRMRSPKEIFQTKGETMNVCGVGELETTS
ncbi:hypothetical protein TNCV_3876901 [Trichonephila clavipes]|uniref:Uncharacterized protein n=1 Tax=Trichonephila clavipes TaxID=2585209 RepID=A0A8X6T0Q7_TRICX|nr:hypothetical protein TNCV_3876901 [Trichonephila clavipes]